jgi:hypothetical protein
MGLSTEVFDTAMFSAVALMVLVTTFMAPPLLRLLFPPVGGPVAHNQPDAIEELVSEA